VGVQIPEIIGYRAGMTSVYYAVTATLPDEATADEYVAWLEDGHVDAVIKGGAHSGMIVRLAPDPPGSRPQVMTQYIFPTRPVFDRYVAVHAPKLREEGASKFGPDRGVSMSRRVGEVV
jgi:hypothetical protein